MHPKAASPPPRPSPPQCSCLVLVAVALQGSATRPSRPDIPPQAPLSNSSKPPAISLSAPEPLPAPLVPPERAALRPSSSPTTEVPARNRDHSSPSARGCPSQLSDADQYPKPPSQTALPLPHCPRTSAPLQAAHTKPGRSLATPSLADTPPLHPQHHCSSAAARRPEAD